MPTPCGKWQLRRAALQYADGLQWHSPSPKNTPTGKSHMPARLRARARLRAPTRPAAAPDRNSVGCTARRLTWSGPLPLHAPLTPTDGSSDSSPNRGRQPQPSRPASGPPPATQSPRVPTPGGIRQLRRAAVQDGNILQWPSRCPAACKRSGELSQLQRAAAGVGPAERSGPECQPWPLG